MLISICIPTYNRSPFLLKNLEIFIDIIQTLKIETDIEIIVSDNNSNDETQEMVLKLISITKKINIQYFRQERSIPIYENQIFTVEKASGDYFMWIGDDDFIVIQYLEKVLDALKNKNIGCIIPSFESIDIEGNSLNGGRDLNLPTKIYKASFYNCVVNSWRGHQMSGLVFKKQFLQEYIKRGINNMYPFIFFSAYSCLRENTLHLTEYPIRVTQPGQKNKAWTYGEDGLINDIFDNYRKLPINYLKKSILEIYFFHIQHSRLWNYKSDNKKEFTNAFIKIWGSQNSTIIFKFIFPIYVFAQIINKKIDALNS